MSRRALHLAMAAMLGTGMPLPALAQVTATSVTLVWTAPGDDSLTGQATRYELRWSPAPITTLAEFDGATAVAGVPLPLPAGTVQSADVGGLTPETTYWFALRAGDRMEEGRVGEEGRSRGAADSLK